MNPTADRMQLIRRHFEREAADFDRLFLRVMPRYEEMTRAVVESVPYRRGDRLRILDLGCGTGNFSRSLAAAFPRARITCVDIAGKMLDMARAKLAGVRGVSFRQCDLRDFDYGPGFDVIAASMALHHIEGAQKPRFYRTLNRALPPGGVFLCIDIFVSPLAAVQRLCIRRWREFMESGRLPKLKIAETLRRHAAEDRPAALMDELEILRGAGFQEIDVIVKHYCFAAYCALKPLRIR